MAHFVKIDADGYVIDAIVIANENAPDPAPGNSEPLGQAFIASLADNEPRLAGVWVQTSYSGAFRNQYAGGDGYRYDAYADVFIAPSPYASWVLDADQDWQPPVPMPTGDGSWSWDEDSQEWIDTTPPEA
jgi:hypothetical protein